MLDTLLRRKQESEQQPGDSASNDRYLEDRKAIRSWIVENPQLVRLADPQDRQHAAQLLETAQVIRDPEDKPDVPGFRYDPSRAITGSLGGEKHVLGRRRYIAFPDEVIGEGGMGRVIRGLDPLFGREVAIKQINPRALERNSGSCLAFVKEARLTANINSPLVPKIFSISWQEFDDGEQVPVIVMERVPESYRSLDKALLEMRIHRKEEVPRLTPQEIWVEVGQLAEVLSQVALLVDTAAQQGIFHKDLKPDNIMADFTSRPGEVDVRVLDFGISNKVYDYERVEAIRGMAGAIGYQSPERAEGMATVNVTIKKHIRYLQEKGRLKDEDVEAYWKEKKQEVEYSSEIFVLASIIYSFIMNESRWALLPIFTTPEYGELQKPENRQQKKRAVLEETKNAVPLPPFFRNRFIRRARFLGFDGEKVIEVLETAWQRDPFARKRAFPTAQDLVRQVFEAYQE